MQKTQKFKVGDIVRFKADPDSQEFADAWTLPKAGLKIREITEFPDGDDIIDFEGQLVRARSQRLEKQPNMFAFGKKNPKIKKLLIDYIEGCPGSGLCWHTESKSDKAYDFLKSQKVFEVNADTPVEYFILRSKKKSTKNAWYNYTTTCSFNDPATPEGRLRIWWATNLAIAASQGKI